jgi:hypothetical protein
LYLERKKNLLLILRITVVSEPQKNPAYRGVFLPAPTLPWVYSHLANHGRKKSSVIP